MNETIVKIHATCGACGLETCPVWCPSTGTMPGIGSWVGKAACGGRVDLMYPETVEATREAKKLCESCPARLDCIEYALEHDEQHGIWGGKTPRERGWERSHLLKIIRRRRAHELELGELGE